MVNTISDYKFSCPFCNNKLHTKFSKCFNVYCPGQKFHENNLVAYRLNRELGIGRIIKKLEIPVSKSLDDEDTSFETKFKVLFENNITKIIHPLDLIHYVFVTNDSVVTKNGVGVVNSNDFLVIKGMLSYEILYPNGKLAQIYEDEILREYKTPIKRLIAKQHIDPPTKFLLKYWANLFHSYYTSYQVKCITNSRLSLMPHQINVAYRLSEDHFPRVILADEVGLGKTIEAGIFIKEMMARNLAERILIIVPATLVKQWQFEMQNKFNIQFTIYDGKKVKDLKKEREFRSVGPFLNPFYYDNLIICSLQFARSRKYIELLSRISWDIVIFDEAHHLRRYLINATTGNYRETLNFELAKNLSQATESLLLLSATPLQLHSFELYSLIELIQREAFDNFSEFEHFRKNMPFINLLVANVDQIDKLNNFEVKNTIKLLKDLKYVSKNTDDKLILDDINRDTFKLNLLNKIEKDHTLSTYLIRNRKKNVFSEEYINERVVHTIIVNPTQNELDLYREIRLYLAKVYNSSMNKDNVGAGFIITTLQKLLTSSKHAFLKSLERRLEQIERLKSISYDLESIREEDPEYFEVELEDEFIDSEYIYNDDGEIEKDIEEDALTLLNQEKILKEFYQKLAALPYDSKCNKLVELLNEIYQRNPQEKILIFTQFVDTLLFLKDLISKQDNNYFVETFYGGKDKVQKDKAVENFRSSNACSVLISTEIGGEGRNFQFARVLVNYDLPWNPMKLEQRIGRLDRIGQASKEIYIYNFYLEGTVETDIMFALDKRINLFEESIGQLEPIIGTIEKDIKNIIFTEEEGKQRKKFNEFNRKLDLEVKKVKEIEMQLDDLLIDKKSFQMDDLITSVAACEDVKLSHNELFLLMNIFFNIDNSKYGVLEMKDSRENLSPHIDNEVKIMLNDPLINNPKYNFIKQYQGTFDLNLAREKEEIDFFALGHSLINQVIEYCRSNAISGTFTILNIKVNSLPDSTIKQLKTEEEMYLFVFEIKYQGYILETQLSSVVVDRSGTENQELSDLILDINQFPKLFLMNNNVPKKANIDKELLETLTNKGKNLVKRKTSKWKMDIQALNDKIFKIEKKKKEKIFAYNKRALNLKIESLKLKLERKQNQKPTQRQLQNIERLEDEKKKTERLAKVINLEEEIRVLERDIINTEKKIDDLSFEYDDLKKEMDKRNLAKFYTNLLSCAILHFTNYNS